MNATARLTSELQAVMGVICPDVDVNKLSLKLEEILTNYETVRKSDEQLEKDLLDNIELYLSAKRLEGLSELTLMDYYLELHLFAEYCSKATVLINTPDIRNYLAEAQKNRELMNSTIGKKLSVLKSFFSWMVQEEIILRNPVLRVKPPKTPNRMTKSLTIEELEIVRESCSNRRQRALVEVMYSTGCRLSEVANMKRDDIDIQNMSMRVVGKGDKERSVFLSFKALYHLRKYLNSRTDDCPYLFVTERKPIRQMKNCSIQREIRKLEEQSGIGKSLHPHKFRHTFAQLGTDQGMELADLQQLLGHSNPTTSLRYAEVSDARKQQAHRKYHVQ